MSGVWVFKNGVVRLVENDRARRAKALLHVPSGELMTSYAALERKLLALGWERYIEDPNLLQFHKRNLNDLISLPRNFAAFSTVYMYDIVVKNRNSFRVIDV